MKKILLISCIATGLLSACKQTDKTKPTVTFHSPADSSVYIAGTDLPFAADFFDDENLAQYKIDIHDNFDGHKHDKFLATIWNRIIIENINGTQTPISRNISIPDSTAAGWYHFQLSAVDESGNQTEVIYRNIFIKNPGDTIIPVVNFVSPTNGYSLPKGNPLSVNADVSDNERVYIVTTRIRKLNSTSNVFLKSDTFGTNMVTYNKEIPTNTSVWTTGEYDLLFTVYDNYFNRYEKHITFFIN